MTPEQLLQPRYEVIADYPNSIFKVGYILTQNSQNENRFEVIIDYLTGYAWIDNPQNYPHLFRRLEWHERRSLNELPNYIKLKNNEGWHMFEVDPLLYTDKNWLRWKHGGYTMKDFLPATVLEYTDYLTKNNQQ